MSTNITNETDNYPRTIEGVTAVNTAATSYMGFEDALKYSKNGYKISSPSICPNQYFKYSNGNKVEFYDKATRSHSTSVDMISVKMLYAQDYFIFD